MTDSTDRTVVSLRTEDVIRDEAANWLVKLDGGLDAGTRSSKDLAKLREWLAEDPRHGAVLKRQATIWEDMDVFANAALTADYGVKIKFWSRFLRPKVVLISAFSCLMLAVAWLFFPLNQSVDEYFLSTNIGSQRVEILSDGSSAYLNTDSLVQINFSESERAINLFRGEVMFDVSHDPDRPFVVYAEGKAIRAVGTRFVVRLTSDRVRVTVTEGQVQFSSQSSYTSDQAQSFADNKTRYISPAGVQELVVLSEGQEAEVEVGKPDMPALSQVAEDELQRKISWVDGRLIFFDETLETIITDISRYTPVRVVITDPELKELRLSGRFQIGDTEALLEAIELSGRGILISRSSSGNMIYISKASG